MNLKKAGQANYNLVVKLLVGLFIIGFLMMFMLGVLVGMYYRTNFYNNNYHAQTQIVNIDNTPKVDKININNCSYEALNSLKGIGEIKAKKIISNRPYNDIYEIKEIVGKTTFENNKNLITI